MTGMPPLDWSRLEALFTDACERAGADRVEFLDRTCAGDAALREELERMLAAHDGKGLGVERRLADDVAPVDPLPGLRLGAYRVVRRIGEGGMGAVYLAERADGAFEQHVAIKILRSAGGGLDLLTGRFHQERRILASLVHPGIARLLDGGLSPEGQPYLVMELVDGEPITTYCDRHRLPVPARLALFRQACDAVQHAHRNLVVHRDLKPSNIFVSTTGEVKLLDFGIAKLLGTPDGSSAPLTRTHLRPMTPEYAAPEQAAGGPITTATDVYALGVLLFELATGLRPPPAGGESQAGTSPSATVLPSSVVNARAPTPDASRASDAEARAHARSTTPARLQRQLRGDLDRIVAMALRAEPERRYSSAGQLSEDIERALQGQPVRAQRDTAAYRVRRFVRRHWVGVGLAAAAVLALWGFLAVAVWQARAVTRERDAARAERDKADRVVSLLVGLFEATSPRVLPRGDRLTLGEFLPRAERRALLRLEGQPELAARMRLVLGRVAVARGRYADAEAHLTEGLRLRRTIAGPQDLEALDLSVALGTALVQLGRQDQARPLLQDAYARLASRRDERTAEAALQLANAFGVREEAGQLLRESLAIRRSAQPVDEAGLSQSLINLGNFLVFSERGAEGLPLLEEALARLDTPAMRRSPLLLTVLNDLAQALIRKDALERAEVLQRRVLALAPEIVDAESIPVANALNNLGGILAAQGRHAQAETMLREAFQMHERLFDAPHPRTANVARNLGIIISLQRRVPEALAWMDRAIALVSATTQDARATAWMRAQRAAVGAEIGDGEQRVRETEQAIADLGAAETPPLAAHLAECRLLYSGLLLRVGRPADALPHAQAALLHFTKTASVPAAKVAWVNVELGRVLAALGRCDEARPHLDSLDVYAAWGLAAPGRVAEATRARAACAGPLRR